MMKRRNIIIILWLLWFVSIIIMVVGVYIYIEKKRDRLHSEIRMNIIDIFEGQDDGKMSITNGDGFFDVVYNGSPVRHYKKVTIPSKPSKQAKSSLGSINPDTQKRMIEDWKQSYGDLSSLYGLNWGDNNYPNRQDDGWNIIRICCIGSFDDDFIQTNIFFPYKVGLKKTNWGNYYTVEQAVNEAFEFYSTNPNSFMADRFSKGSYNRIWAKIVDCGNEFYWVVENQKTNRWKQGIPIYYPKGKKYNEIVRTMPYESGWMHNGYYRVFIAATQERHYMIQEKDWAINENRKTLLIWWGIGLSILFLSLIIPPTIKEHKVNKMKSETLYQRLCRMCNPSNFIKDYNKEKVDKANEIYQRLMEIKQDDKDALMALQAEAVSSLGIAIVDREKLKDLIEKVNPQRFMNPYNAEKVKIANDFYSRLTNEDLTYEEFTQIEEESKTL